MFALATSSAWVSHSCFNGAASHLSVLLFLTNVYNFLLLPG